MQKMLESKRLEIHSAIANEQNKLEKIATMSGILVKERVNMLFDVELKELKAQKVLSLRKIVLTPENEPLLWEKLYSFIDEKNIQSEVGGYSIYHDEDYEESDVDIEIAVPVKELGENQGEFVFKELPAIQLAATIRFSGSYEGYSDAIEKLADWIEKNGYEFDGLMRGHGIVLPSEGIKQEDYLTELQVPIKKA
jgi:effector-binding domain-containing protein